MTKALIVDDSPSMRELLSYVLSKLPGLEVETAQDGLDGFKKLLSSRYDLVITEIYMPIMDGCKLARLIRSDPNHKHIPILVLTRETDRESRKNMLSCGANEYLTKPIQAPDVLSLVKRLLSEKKF
ncbi:MAG: response regulator [Deltaproteobacteria bacterium]|nr:response regulator [Deltaproteobacteria bacterium]